MHVLKSSPLQKLSYVFICAVFYLVVCSIFDLVTTYSKRKQLNAATLQQTDVWNCILDSLFFIYI